MQRYNLPMTTGRCLLAGLLTGLLTAVIVVAFNVIYRGAVDLIAYDVVMPISIFVGFPLINLIAGGAYYLFIGHLRKGQAWYSIVVLLVTVLVAVITAVDGRSADVKTAKFRGLVLRLVVIEGFMAAFILPYLTNHPKLFLTDKDIRGEE